MSAEIGKLLIGGAAVATGGHALFSPTYYRRRLVQVGDIPTWLMRVVGALVIVTAIYGLYVEVTAPR
jgi:hypothetical protein